jgi:uncharacterized membrane protein YvbJ
VALVQCAECGKQMSNEAMACPACGRPNKLARNKQMDGHQRTGCALMLLAAIIALVSPTIGGVVFLVGLVLVLVYTRVW